MPSMPTSCRFFGVSAGPGRPSRPGRARRNTVVAARRPGRRRGAGRAIDPPRIGRHGAVRRTARLTHGEPPPRVAAGAPRGWNTCQLLDFAGALRAVERFAGLFFAAVLFTAFLAAVAFFATDFLAAVVFLATDFFAAAFFAGAFLAADFLAVVFFAVVFFAVVLRAAVVFFAAVFFAVVLLAVVFFAVAFLAGAFAAVFFAAARLAGALFVGAVMRCASSAKSMG